MTVDRAKNLEERALGWIWYLTGLIKLLAVFGTPKSVLQGSCKKRQNTLQI
jgi:hypothetical protein